MVSIDTPAVARCLDMTIEDLLSDQAVGLLSSAIGARQDTDFATKDLCEVAWARVADLQSNLHHCATRLAQQAPGSFHSHAREVTAQRQPRALLERAREVGFAQLGFPGQPAKVQFAATPSGCTTLDRVLPISREAPPASQTRPGLPRSHAASAAGPGRGGARRTVRARASSSAVRRASALSSGRSCHGGHHWPSTRRRVRAPPPWLRRR